MLRRLSSCRLQDWQWAEEALKEAEDKEAEKQRRRYETLHTSKLCPLADLHD